MKITIENRKLEQTKKTGKKMKREWQKVNEKFIFEWNFNSATGNERSNKLRMGLFHFPEVTKSARKQGWK